MGPTVSVVEVRDAQHALRQLGLYGGAIDGIEGPGTAFAVRTFQQTNMRKKNGGYPKGVCVGALDGLTVSRLIDAIAHHDYVAPVPPTDLEMKDARIALLRTQRLLNSWEEQ